MLINRSDRFPTKNQYDMKASGSLGYGLIKTVSETNEFYCSGEDCDYSVSIECLGVEHFNFFPTILPNGSELKFNNFL